MRSRVLLVVVALLSAAIATGATASAGAATSAAKKNRLVAFKSCDGLVRYARHHAIDTMKADQVRTYSTPVFAGGGEAGGAGGQPTAPMPAAPAAGGDSSGGGGTRGQDFSGTNVQEEGVDEPDEVKTDGSTIYAVAGDALQVVDVRAGGARVVDTLRLEGYGHQLLLEGNRLIVFSQDQMDAPPPSQPEPGPAADSGAAPASSPAYSPYVYRPATVITEVAVGDPADVKVLNRMKVDGNFVGARLSGGTIRTVVSSAPIALAHTPTPAGEDPSAARREQIQSSRSSQWRPAAVLTRRRTKRARAHSADPAPAVRCQDVRHARQFGGLDMLTVLTLDVDRGLPEIDADSVMTTAELLYASGTDLFVATQQWLPEDATAEDVPPGASTLIHRFDASKPDETRYRASGRVRGYLLNQFSMSERGGVLRTATTSMPTWIGGTEPAQSESYVTTLEERDGKLVQLGRVDGLGKGERIYAVRFIDDVGYVVTFRQTDPLYTIALGDPANPRVLGELKILGYSAYLHPVGDDLLLGVGQDATEEGRRLGAQLSLFDVSDLRDPKRLHQRSLGTRSSTSAEYDHHAFLYWPATRLTVIPVTRWGRTQDETFLGALGFRVGRDQGFEELGSIEHNAPEQQRWQTMIKRSLVIRDRVFTLSDRGLAAHTLDGLQPAAYVPFE